MGGKRGSQPFRGPIKSMMRECWQYPYEIYKWTGEGVAGLALYMVSNRFLNQVPQMIHDYGFDMVDAYINKLCNLKGPLKCYSVKAVPLVPAPAPAKPEEHEEKDADDEEEPEGVKDAIHGHWDKDSDFFYQAQKKKEKREKKKEETKKEK